MLNSFKSLEDFDKCHENAVKKDKEKIKEIIKEKS